MPINQNSLLNTTTLQEGIVDIEFLPPLQSIQLNGFALSAWAILLFVLILFGWFNYRHYLQIRWKLWQLKRQFQQLHIANRTTAFQLATLLRYALSVKNVYKKTPITFKQEAEKSRWLVFNQRLADARYAPNIPSEKNILALLQEAKYWLRYCQ